MNRKAVCSKTGLSPFYTQNKPPAISIVCASTLHLIFLNCAIFEYPLLMFKQGEDPFWEKKPQEKATKPSRPKTKAVKKTTKRKAPEPIGFKLHDDSDEPEAEVELDSLGSLFMHLIDNDTYQEDVEGSQADDAEVIIISFSQILCQHKKSVKQSRK